MEYIDQVFPVIVPMWLWQRQHPPEGEWHMQLGGPTSLAAGPASEARNASLPHHPNELWTVGSEEAWLDWLLAELAARLAGLAGLTRVVVSPLSLDPFDRW